MRLVLIFMARAGQVIIEEISVYCIHFVGIMLTGHINNTKMNRN